MIPYFELKKLFTVPIINKEVHFFGLMVLTAVLVGLMMSFYKARKENVDTDTFIVFSFCLLVSAFFL